MWASPVCGQSLTTLQETWIVLVAGRRAQGPVQQVLGQGWEGHESLPGTQFRQRHPLPLWAPELSLEVS